MRPEDVTLDDMIDYSQRALGDATFDDANSVIVLAIVKKLKLLKKMEANWPHEANATTPGPEQLNEDEIGELIKKKVEFTELLNRATAVMAEPQMATATASSPDYPSGASLDQMRPRQFASVVVIPEPALITKYRQEIALLNGRLRNLKTIQKGNLMHKLASIDTSLDSSSLERKDEAELRNFRKEVVAKIAAIDAELKTL